MKTGQMQDREGHRFWPTFTHSQSEVFSFNPIAYGGGGGGGGGYLSHTNRVSAATLKPLKLWLPNFVTCFYIFATT